MKRLLGTVAIVGGLALVPAPLEAQMSEADSESVVVEADSLHRALEPAPALARLRSALQTEPDRPELLWRAARESVHLGMMAEDDDAAGRWFDASARYARRLIEADSSDARGWSWLSISLGRQSELRSPTERVEYARRVKEAAERALELDPDESGALHVLGAWHAEILRLGGLTRFVARRLLGAEIFDEASWEEARRLLERAVETAPEEIVHRVELARVLIEGDDEPAATAQLETALDLEILHPSDPGLQREARELLERISG